MKPIREFEIIDHGVEHTQYFQGCGTAYTPYDLCVTGCGDSYAEALEDALENLAQNEYEVKTIEESAEVMEDKQSPDFHKTVADCLGWTENEEGETVDEEGDSTEDNEMHYYLSIRVK